MQRKLTAILSADIVGFSGLMEADEAGTLLRLKANRQAIFDPMVAAHGGRIVKLMGDGALVEFASVVDAVDCALKIQTATGEAEPEHGDRHIRYRIGVNLGDVLVEGDDIYGDGVNVAARLQTIAPPGGVALSGTVRDHVVGKIACEFEDLGPHTVKNIERPIHVFTVRPAAPASAPPPARAEAPADPPRRLSICVLPFSNMSGEQEQEYFSDGITEDIITDLSKVGALVVISRNSAFVYKGKNIDLPQVARQLGVTHVLEGSVRKSGGRVRVTAQLIDGASNGHVWAERYDRDLNDIFALQDEISSAIVKAMKLSLLPREKEAIEKRGTTSLDAYNLFLMARKYYMTGSLSSRRRYEAIVRLCARAVEIDPDYARAWALLAVAQASLRTTFGDSRETGLAAAERALALDPALPEAYAARARAKIVLGDFEGAVDDAHAGYRIDKESYELNTVSAVAHFALHRFPQAIRLWREAAALSATDYLSRMMVMTTAVAMGDREGARQAAQQVLALTEDLVAREPDNGTALATMVGALATLGNEARARDVAARALIIDPENVLMRYNLARAFASGLHDTDGALDLLEPVFAVFATGLGAMSWIRIEPDFDGLREHPRFQAMLAAAEARLAAL
jgi:adenylate cyclase